MIVKHIYRIILGKLGLLKKVLKSECSSKDISIFNNVGVKMT